MPGFTPCRAFIATIFDDELTRDSSNTARLGERLRTGASFRYACWQLERCPDTNRRHIQLYCELSNAKRAPTWLQRTLGLDHQPHCEARRGSREQAKAYCSKEETREDGPWEEGTFENGGQGRRTDLQEAAGLLTGAGAGTELFPAIICNRRQTWGPMDLEMH